MEESTRERSLLIGDWGRSLSSREGNRQGSRGGNHYMRGGAQCAAGVRYFRRCMYVRDLKRGAEKQ
jgi:hypothetical protein